MDHKDWLFMDGFASGSLTQIKSNPAFPPLFSLWNYLREVPPYSEPGVNKLATDKGRWDFTQMEQLPKVINQVSKFVQERVPFPLGEQIHEFMPGDQVWVKDWKHDSLAPHWKGPYTVVLTSPTCMHVRVGLWRKLSAEELMFLNCGVGEDSWESLGLQGDPTSPF